MNSYEADDIVKQITLNCLISKSQLMKINDKKIKKQMDVERNKQIKNKYEDLVELYQQLLNHTEPNDLFDDVKEILLRVAEYAHKQHSNYPVYCHKIIDKHHQVV